MLKVVFDQFIYHLSDNSQYRYGHDVIPAINKRTLESGYFQGFKCEQYVRKD